MNDPPGVSSALGIEAVEWVAEGGENLTVRVTGRWRRRRPAWSGQPTLVVEAPGRRYRFPAMPEPPSLTGIGPGMWRISFAVPAALAPELGGRAWLQFGSVSVPLPAAIGPPGPGEIEPPGLGEVEPASPAPAAADAGPGELDPVWRAPADPALEPSAELTGEAARRRAGEAEAAAEALAGRVTELERALASARAEVERLSAAVAGQQATRRAAEQRAHAERALRLELTRQLAGHTRERLRAREGLGELAAAEDRMRGLEGELAEARRRIDEAEQAVAAAVAARQRAERAGRAAGSGPAQLSPSAASAERARLASEAGLRARRESSPRRVPEEPPLGPASSAEAAPEGLLTALRRELDLRARAEIAAQRRLLEAEARLAARTRLARRVDDTLLGLRGELDGLRAAFDHEHSGRLAAERRADELAQALEVQRRRSREASVAIADLRKQIEAVAGPPGSTPSVPASPGATPSGLVSPSPGPRPSGLVSPSPASPPLGPEAERLNDALARLRERVAPREGEPAPGPAAASPATLTSPAPAAPVPAAPSAGRSWLEPVFRRLVRRDPERAGRLLLDLLPAQRVAYPESVSYDLVLDRQGPTIRVNSRNGAPVIVHERAPRDPADVDFQVFGDPAAVARRLLAGRWRRFGRRVARVRGDRAKVAALESLIALRLDFAGLVRAGVRLAPRTAMVLIAELIDPTQTAQESFVLAYEPEPGGEEEAVFLLIRGGVRPEVTGVRPAGRIATTVSGPAGAIERALAGERAGVTVSGDQWPLALVRKWVKRAQSG